jgi:hypothetical protein
MVIVIEGSAIPGSSFSSAKVRLHAPLTAVADLGVIANG